MNKEEYELRKGECDLLIKSLKQIKMKYWHDKHPLLTNILLLGLRKAWVNEFYNINVKIAKSGLRIIPMLDNTSEAQK